MPEVGYGVVGVMIKELGAMAAARKTGIANCSSSRSQSNRRWAEGKPQEGKAGEGAGEKVADLAVVAAVREAPVAAPAVVESRMETLHAWRHPTSALLPELQLHCRLAGQPATRQPRSLQPVRPRRLLGRDVAQPTRARARCTRTR